MNDHQDINVRALLRMTGELLDHARDLRDELPDQAGAITVLTLNLEAAYRSLAGLIGNGANVTPHGEHAQ